jgi:hypothetical protein
MILVIQCDSLTKISLIYLFDELNGALLIGILAFNFVEKTCIFSFEAFAF